MMNQIFEMHGRWVD